MIIDTIAHATAYQTLSPSLAAALQFLQNANLAAMDREQVTFIAPASKTYVAAEVLCGLDVSAAAPVEYVAQRDAGKAADQRGSWRVMERLGMTRQLSDVIALDDQRLIIRAGSWQGDRSNNPLQARGPEDQQDRPNRHADP